MFNGIIRSPFYNIPDKQEPLCNEMAYHILHTVSFLTSLIVCIHALAHMHILYLPLYGSFFMALNKTSKTLSPTSPTYNGNIRSPFLVVS